MVRRYLLKIVVFVIIISYFSFYKYNSTEHQADETYVSHLTTLLLQEQQLVKQLNMTMDPTVTFELLEQQNIPYVDGKLLSLTQLTEHIVVANFSIVSAKGFSFKPFDKIAVTYTGFIHDELAPTTNRLYRILLKEPDNKNDYFYIQGGLKGILPLSE